MSCGNCTVHVFDEAAQRTKDFSCRTDTLLSSMRYFRGYLKDVQPQQNVMISVHCDVQVFEWLLQFAQKGGQQQPIAVATAMPILISSNFLGMDDLVNLCLSFVAQNLVEVACVSPDLAALPTELLQRLAKVVGEEQLEALHTRSSSNSSPVLSNSNNGDAAEQQQDTKSTAGGPLIEQLSGRLFKHKIELLLRELRTTVARCSQCGAMFSLTERSKLSCPMRDGEHGWGPQGGRQRILGHDPDPTWRLQDHLAALRAVQPSAAAQRSDSSGGSSDTAQPPVSWRDIYWDVWSVVNVLYCSHCLKFFPAQELATCCHHPEQPIFLASKNVGRYPCCGGHAQRSGNVQLFRGGCCARDHTIMAQPGNGTGSDRNDMTASAAGGALPHVLHVLETFRHLVVPETCGALSFVEWGADGAGEEEEGAEDSEEGIDIRRAGCGREVGASALGGGVGPSSLELARAVYSGAARGRGRNGAGRGTMGARPMTSCGPITAARASGEAIARPSTAGPSGAGSIPSRGVAPQLAAKPGALRASSERPSSGAPNGLMGAATRTTPPLSRLPTSDDSHSPRAGLAGTARASGTAVALRTSAAVGIFRGGQGAYSDEDAGGMCSPRPAEMLDVLKLAAVARGEAQATSQQPNRPVPDNPGNQGTPKSGQRGDAGTVPQSSSFSAATYMQRDHESGAVPVPVKVVPLSNLQGSGGVGRAGGPMQAGGAMARKLRLELLHEDDVARMDALIGHLAACRPTQARSRAAVGALPAPSKLVAAGSGAQGSGAARGTPAGHLRASAGGGAGGLARSSSVTRAAREVAGARGAATTVTAVAAGALPSGRPMSAPRMRPPLAPVMQSTGQGSMQRAILAQR